MDLKAAREDRFQSSELKVDGSLTANEFIFVLKDGKRMLKRVLVEGGLLA